MPLLLGPIWTPLIPSSFSAKEVEVFGTDVPLKRAGQPFELAPAYRSEERRVGKECM